MSDFYNRILNLRIDKEQAAFADRTPRDISAYKAGYREAQYAAAEIALEADQQIAAAKEMAEALLAWNAADEHWVKCADCADEQKPMCNACFAILQSAREKRVAALAAYRTAAKEGR